ncbi:probable 2-oxoacid dependent dioxygenase [Phragmites australis]|uniref:probable 2-oxoacid dependent dioxygenase n=1 Tax=Phragmites australis TaxID=29695 RepID=UPI002D788E4D|nr:probable 2-oxoacid dependent dioxygenase [Phragmites australis]
MSATSPVYDRTAELRALDTTLAGVRGLVASGATHVPRIFMPPGQEPSVATVTVIDLGCADRATVLGCGGVGVLQGDGRGVPGEAMATAVRAFHDADGGEGSDKARLYSREPGNAVKYHCLLDLYQSPVVTWCDTLYLHMAPDPPIADELPESYRLPVSVPCLLIVL